MDTAHPFWEVDGKTTFAALLQALVDFLPKDCILYFEGGSPDQQILDFFNAHAIPEQTHVAIGTLWPRPVYYHVPATSQNLLKLTTLAECHAEPELAIHFHAYQEGKVLLEWHDAFSQHMLLSGTIPENEVKSFADTLNMTFKLNSGYMEQSG